MATSTRNKHLRFILNVFFVAILLALYYSHSRLQKEHVRDKKRYHSSTVKTNVSKLTNEEITATLEKQAYKQKLVNSSVWIQDYQVYQNICIVENYDDLSLSEPFVPYLVSYDTTRKQSTNKFRINADKRRFDSFWIVNNKNGSVPNDWKIKHGIAFFPSFLRDSLNIFLLWHSNLPSAYGQLKYAKERPFYQREHVTNSNSSSTEFTKTGQQKKLSHILIATSLEYMKESYQSTILSLGYDHLADYKSQLEQSPICYKYGIIGEQSTRKYRIKAKEIIKSLWLKNKPKCEQLHVLLLQRKTTRRILDIDYIKEILEKVGVKNVRIMSFEGLSLAEQFDIIRCTALLIGVQGAGLSWYPFLPKHASVIEFVFVGWPSRYYSRFTSERPDLLPYTMACSPDTPDYIISHYARKWFNHTGPITQDIKRQLVIKSREYYPIYDTIWKDSDCWCSTEFFTNKLSKITARVKGLMRDL